MIEKYCFLDMDGVLIKFVQAAIKLHNIDIKYEDVNWEFDKDHCAKVGMTIKEFWDALDYNFWANLEPTDEYLEILKIVERKFGKNVCLLSSPATTNGCTDGKFAWVNKWIPQYRKRVLLGACKEAIAGPSKILIDDHYENVRNFYNAGGRAVLVPRPWNNAKLCEPQLLYKLEEALNEIR